MPLGRDFGDVAAIVHPLDGPKREDDVRTFRSRAFVQEMPGDPPSGDPPLSSGRKADGTFAPGNKAGKGYGRPLGARGKATAMLDAIMHKNVPDIAKKLVEAAKNGEHWAVTLALKDQMPGRAGTPFELPPIDSAADLPAAAKSVLEQMASGRLTPTEGAAVLAGLESHGRIATLAGHEERLAAVEALLAANAKNKTNGER
jgi:hypothetical protein